MNETKIMPLFKKLYEDMKNKNFVIDKTGVKTVEVIDANIKELNPEQEILNFNGRKTPLKYVKKELNWYDSMDLNIKGHVDDIEIWKKVSSDDGFINSNYGWCIYSPENHKQYKNSLNELIKNPESRRAMMIYTRPSMHYDYNRDGMSDFICTNTTQQFIRNNKLIYRVDQRSMDMVFGLFNDLAWHQTVYNRFYNDLKKEYPNLEKGYININIGSAHVYERHFGMLEKIVENA